MIVLVVCLRLRFWRSSRIGGSRGGKGFLGFIVAFLVAGLCFFKFIVGPFFRTIVVLFVIGTRLAVLLRF